MKLDKLKFARLVLALARDGWCGSVTELDDMLDIDVPEPTQMVYPATSDINRLMALMVEGTQKIEAIKLHRKLTGWGLKESKDEVEKYWVAKKPKEEGSTLGDILGHATNRPPVNFDKFEG